MMFRTALISLDYSAAQGPLLDCLSDLRDMGVNRVVLTHVTKVGYGQGAGYGQEDALKDWLTDRASPMHAAGLEVTIDIRAAGDVASDILQAAHDHGADLIVIGSRGQNMVRGLFLGSVARAVIRSATLAVRLEWIEATGEDGDAACARACNAGLRHVLLATDFSRPSQPAEQAAIALARNGAHVDVVHVLTPGNKAVYARLPRIAQSTLTFIADDIIAAGGQADVHLLKGDPATEIAGLAAARDIDLIIVGKQGTSWVKSVLIGSTASKLCEIARRPVLMMPLNPNEV